MLRQGVEGHAGLTGNGSRSGQLSAGPQDPGQPEPPVLFPKVTLAKS